MTSTDIEWLRDADRNVDWLVGVSGGADSVALLHLLVTEGFCHLVVCHVDHQLRGDESTGDAEFVRQLAAQLGLEFEGAGVDVRRRMVQRGESMETAARALRHEFFGQCAERRGIFQVLLAHHAEDQAETVLWNLLRGSHGLKGMAARQKISTESGVSLEMVRPLLGVRKAELLDWLKMQGHTWREDSSNQEPVAVRNRLRAEVFPLLETITGRDAVAAFVRAEADQREMECCLHDWLAGGQWLDPQGRLHLPTLRGLPVSIRRCVIKDFLKQHGISQVDRPLLDQAAAMTTPEGPHAINLPGGAFLRRKEGRIVVVDRSSPGKSYASGTFSDP